MWWYCEPGRLGLMVMVLKPTELIMATTFGTILEDALQQHTVPRSKMSHPFWKVGFNSDECTFLVVSSEFASQALTLIPLVPSKFPYRMTLERTQPHTDFHSPF